MLLEGIIFVESPAPFPDPPPPVPPLIGADAVPTGVLAEVLPPPPPPLPPQLAMAIKEIINNNDFFTFNLSFCHSLFFLLINSKYSDFNLK